MAARPDAEAALQAFILAGGLGTRLRSLVADRPKGMAAVEGKPFLAHQLNFLRRHGVTRVVLCVGYRRQAIEDYFGGGGHLGLRIDYAIEDRPLGTAGALRNGAALADPRFLVLNGDSLLDLDLAELVAAHREHVGRDGRCLGTLALTYAADTRAYGRVTLDAGGRLTAFAEKPGGEIGTGLVSAGLYMFERPVLERIPPGQAVSLEEETLPSLLAAGDHLYGYPVSGFFVDIGTPDGLLTFRRHVASQRCEIAGAATP